MSDEKKTVSSKDAVGEIHATNKPAQEPEKGTYGLGFIPAGDSIGLEVTNIRKGPRGTYIGIGKDVIDIGNGNAVEFVAPITMIPIPPVTPPPVMSPPIVPLVAPPVSPQTAAFEQAEAIRREGEFMRNMNESKSLRPTSPEEQQIIQNLINKLGKKPDESCPEGQIMQEYGECGDLIAPKQPEGTQKPQSRDPRQNR